MASSLRRALSKTRTLKFVFCIITMASLSYALNNRGLLEHIAAKLTRPHKVHNQVTPDPPNTALTASAPDPKERGDHSSEGSWTDGMDFESYQGGTSRAGASASTSPTPWMTDDQPLRVPCGVILPTASARVDDDIKNNHKNILPVRTILDTGLTHTIITREKAKEIGLIARMEKHVQKESWGTSIGFVPTSTYDDISTVIRLRMGSTDATVPAPIIHVVKSLPKSVPDDIDLVLGLDFLRERQAVVDLRENEVRMKDGDGVEVMVPLLRLRGGTNGGDKETTCVKPDGLCSSNE